MEALLLLLGGGILLRPHRGRGQVGRGIGQGGGRPRSSRGQRACCLEPEDSEIFPLARGGRHRSGSDDVAVGPFQSWLPSPLGEAECPSRQRLWSFPVSRSPRRDRRRGGRRERGAGATTAAMARRRQRRRRRRHRTLRWLPSLTEFSLAVRSPCELLPVSRRRVRERLARAARLVLKERERERHKGESFSPLSRRER